MLAAAQFVMVLDTTVMNVAISDVVADLDTKVARLQAAITAYALVMAALMLTGGKLGDIFGRRCVFAVGLAIYGVGSATTAIAPGITTLLVGWSALEGIGASLVVPAIAALIAGNYRGAQRAGLRDHRRRRRRRRRRRTADRRRRHLGGVVALGLRRRGRHHRGDPGLDAPDSGPAAPAAPAAARRRWRAGVGRRHDARRLRDPAGRHLGLVRSAHPPQIAGHEITPLGLSPTQPLVVLGIDVLVLFLRYERRQIAVGREPIVRPDLLRIPRLRGGLASMIAQQSFGLGALFVIPLSLQVVVGKDAFGTGVMLPLAIGMLVMAVLGSGWRNAWRRSGSCRSRWWRWRAGRRTAAHDRPRPVLA